MNNNNVTLYSNELIEKKGTDLRTLPDGTVFWVKNGAWGGKIFSKNGKKYVHVTDTNDDLPISDKHPKYLIDIICKPGLISQNAGYTYNGYNCRGYKTWFVTAESSGNVYTIDIFVSRDGLNEEGVIYQSNIKAPEDPLLRDKKFYTELRKQYKAKELICFENASYRKCLNWIKEREGIVK